MNISLLELDWNEIIADETIEMVSIIDYFLNPQKTVQDTNSTQGFLKRMVSSSQKLLNTVIGEVVNENEKNGRKTKMANNMVNLTNNNQEQYYDENQKLLSQD